MATTISDVLAGALSGFRHNGVAEQFVSLTEQLRQLQASNQAVADSTKENTRAVERSASGGPTASTAGRVVQGVFGFGLGLSPLITGLLRLFGGGGGVSAPPPLVRFSLPPPVNATAGVTSEARGVVGVDYWQGGVPRAEVAGAPQITVQVQALDSRSFLDHSAEIALAVRQAMLESSVLNDVIREA
jgi:hypothetical protein